MYGQRQVQKALVRDAKIEGLIRPHRWNNEGVIQSVKICGEGGQIYQLVENFQAKELLKYLQDWVSLRGDIYQSDQGLEVQVTSFDVFPSGNE